MKAIAEKLLLESISRFAPQHTGERIAVLCYHQIVPRDYPADQIDRFTVYQHDFDDQIRAVRDAGYQILRLDEIKNLATNGFQGKGAVITFDDNLATHRKYAVPVLQQHGVTATFFLNPELLGIDGEMDEADVGQLADVGMQIGAHNGRHVIVSQMSSADFSSAIDICDQFLRRHNMQKFWAYPGGYLGSFRPCQDAELQTRGFIRFSTLEGSLGPEHWSDLGCQPLPRYVLRINSSPRYMRAILEGRLGVLAKLKKGRFAIEQRIPALARS